MFQLKPKLSISIMNKDSSSKVSRDRRYDLLHLAIKNAVRLGCFVFSCSAFSWNFHVDQIYFSALGGFDWPDASDTTTMISESDTEINHVSSITSGTTWGAGVGWHACSHLWLDADFYKMTTTLSGPVWDYSNPDFSEYRFSAPFASSRLMLDVEPVFFTRSYLSFYGIAGLGEARNSVSYSETPTDSGALSLNKKNSNAFSYEFGVGMTAHVVDHLMLQIEYLWSALGSASPESSSSNAAVLNPPQFTVNDQNVLVGFSLAL